MKQSKITKKTMTTIRTAMGKWKNTTRDAQTPATGTEFGGQWLVVSLVVSGWWLVVSSQGVTFSNWNIPRRLLFP
jgi:hypothetical protein